jgi:hypothetical membrane protein
MSVVVRASRPSHPSRPSRAAVAGVALLTGAIGFLALERLAVWSYPGFDPSLQPLSGLGNLAAPTRWIWILASGLLSGSWLVAATLVVRRTASAWVLALNLVPVVGILVAVAVPLDANLGIHELAAFIALVTGSVAMVVNTDRLTSGWRTAALGLSAGGLAAMSPAAAILVGRVGWGTLERIVVAPLLASQVAFGLALLLGGLAIEGSVARRSQRRTALLLVAAIVPAVGGVGTGITAGGATVVAAELTRVVNSFHVAR